MAYLEESTGYLEETTGYLEKTTGYRKESTSCLAKKVSYPEGTTSYLIESTCNTDEYLDEVNKTGFETLYDFVVNRSFIFTCSGNKFYFVIESDNADILSKILPKKLRKKLKIRKLGESLN